MKRKTSAETIEMNHRISSDFRISGTAKGEKTTPAEKVAKTAIAGAIPFRRVGWFTTASSASAQKYQPWSHVSVRMK
jgi:hypothetical protein